jgi:hypothetical protein
VAENFYRLLHELVHPCPVVDNQRVTGVGILVALMAALVSGGNAGTIVVTYRAMELEVPQEALDTVFRVDNVDLPSIEQRIKIIKEILANPLPFLTVVQGETSPMSSLTGSTGPTVESTVETGSATN